jgi:arylsulfatase
MTLNHTHAEDHTPPQPAYSWRFWTAPFLLGVPVAMVAGVYVSLPTLLEQGYLHLGLSRTGFTLLALATDRWALGMVGFLYLLLLAFYTGSLAKGKAGKVLGIALPPVVAIAPLIFGILRFPLVRLSAQSYVQRLPELTLALITSPVTLSGLLAAFLILGVALARTRRRRSAPPTSADRRSIHPRRLLVGALFCVASLFILAFLAVNLAAAALTVHAHRTLAARPNIIFIMADTLRADHVGCYGYDLPTTPRIDEFARDGLRFESALAQSSWTVWSVMSLMTSHYPETLFPLKQGQSQQLHPGDFSAQLFYPTLAEILRDQGYSTHAVIGNPYLHAHHINTQGFDSYDDAPSKLPVSQPTSPTITAAAVKHLATIKDRKFFLYLLYMDPHAPYLTHDEFAFGDSAQDAARTRALAVTDPALLAKRRKDLRAYDSDIAYTDHHIGQFLDALKREGLYDDALIVFFSDHGEEFLEHGEFGHMRTVYEEVIQVPLIIKLPRQQRRGAVVRGTFPLIDLYPSLLEHLGIKYSQFRLSGEAVDFTTLLRNRAKPLYSTTIQGVQSVRIRTRKYIRTIDSEQAKKNRSDGQSSTSRVMNKALYDLAADPLEQHDLLQSAPVDAAALAALLQAHDTEQRTAKGPHAPHRSGSFRNADPTMIQDQDLLERLKALGYLNPDTSP